MAKSNIEKKKYRVLVAGHMFNSHYKKGDEIWLYRQQAVNLIAPLGDKIELWDDESEEPEEVETSPYDGKKKSELIDLIIERNKEREDEEAHITYKGNATIDALKEILKRDDLLSEIKKLNADRDEDNIIQVNDDMSLEVLIDLIKAAA